MTGKLKKALLPNLPYLLFAWLFDKLCQAVRLSPGADASEKLLRIAQGFTEAFASLWLSLHPLDLLLGVAGAALAAAGVCFFCLGRNVTLLLVALWIGAGAIPLKKRGNRACHLGWKRVQ